MTKNSIKFLTIYGSFGPKKRCLNFISRVQGKNLPHREVRRPMVLRFARDPRVGLAPKRVS